MDVFNDAGALTTALWVGLVAFAAYAVLVWLAAMVWVANDSQRRTTSPWMQVASIALVGLLWLPGLVVYIALRPQETLEEAAERRLEFQALAAESQRRSCPRCYRAVGEDFVRCPYCANQLGVRCDACSRIVEDSWVACAFCGDDRRGVTVGREGRSALQPKLQNMTPSQKGHTRLVTR